MAHRLHVFLTIDAPIGFGPVEAQTVLIQTLWNECMNIELEKEMYE